MSAIKPLGRSPKELGKMVYDLAMGGCPIIKDDHSLMNQDYAPLRRKGAPVRHGPCRRQRKNR